MNHRLTIGKNKKENIEVADQLKSNFLFFSDKEQATKVLFELTNDEDSEVRQHAASALGSAFNSVTDKNEATKILLRLTKDTDSAVRWSVAGILGAIFKYLPDKNQSWEILHKLTYDADNTVRWGITGILSEIFNYVPDKKQAWEDLHKLSHDEDTTVRWGAAIALGNVFSHILDKNLSWEDLHRLSKDKESYVRRGSAKSIGVAYSFIVDKEQAWVDLIRLTQDTETSVREEAVESLSIAYAFTLDKRQAWEDLIKLTLDENIDVRLSIAKSLGVAFPHNLEKKQAWEDLLKLMKNKDDAVRWGVAESLGVSYAFTSDKKQAWEDLIKLSLDKDFEVQSSVYYSLGRVSIIRAINAESEEKFREELGKVLEYFEKSSKEMNYFNLSRFCLPFYKSFYSIAFGGQESETDVKKYLIEAKIASEGSKKKEKLLEAVENLANALNEVQKTRNLRESKRDLNTYRKYCDQAAGILAITEINAPVATNLIKRGLPIIDERINQIIVEMQGNTKELCKHTKDTPFEDLGREVSKIGKNLLQVRDPIGLEKSIHNIQIVLSVICARLPEKEKKQVCELLKNANKETYLEDKINLINIVLAKIPAQMEFQNEELVFNKINTIQDKINIVDSLPLAATIAAFISFINLEMLEIYPIGYKHLISISIAIVIFFIVLFFTWRKNKKSL